MMGHTVMLLSPWDAPQPLTRAWCLWELHCTVETASVFSILLGPAEKAAFRADLAENHGASAIAALSTIDVRKAQAGDPNDLMMILGAVGATEGGAEALNERAVRQLREMFVVNEARKWVTELRSPGGSLETPEAVIVGVAVAELLGVELGKWEESQQLWEEVLAGREQLEEAEDMPGMLVARRKLADAMMHTGKASEARVMYERVLAKLIKQFGPEHGSVLATQANFASALIQMGKYEEALKLEDVVVEAQTKLLGPAHEQTLQARGNRAGTYHKLGRYGEVRAEYEAVLKGFLALPHLGPRHPTTMVLMHNLAVLLHEKLGEKEAAVRMLQEVVKVRTTVLGGNNPDTQMSARILASWKRVLDPHHLATLAVGVDVVWSGDTDSIPAGTVGEVIAVQKGGGRRIRFPTGTWTFPSDRLGEFILATKEQQLVGAAGFDRALPLGTRISVSPHGAGSYVSFQRKRFGANQHTIDFDSTGKQVVQLKGLRWSTVGSVLTGAASE